MRKITWTAALSLFLLQGALSAQSSCSDLNGYVDSKNTSTTGYYTLQSGQEENASQTYHYSGPGRISSVRVYGNYVGLTGGVPLRVGIYDVDANGRPTTLIQSANDTWWWFDNAAGYTTVYFAGGGVYVDDNFAISVEIRHASPWGSTFQVKYTGDGEGNGQDLASLAGTTTGFNWSSAMTNFGKDGDFYLVPRMTNYIEPAISLANTCYAVNAPVAFGNSSEMTTDSMFNTIGLAAYSGSSYFYSWDFGDGSPVSHAVTPTHAYSTAGSYTVSLTCSIDGWNNDCSASVTKVVSVGLGVTATSANASCSGSATGSVTATGNGGTSPYLYSIDGGNNYQPSGAFSNMQAGTYTVLITDANGCSSSVVSVITEPAAIVISGIYPTSSSCGTSNGALAITASGGTGTLQYQVNNGGYQANSQFMNLASGFYAVDVKDANGCIVSNAGIVSDQGGPTLSVLSQTNASCNNSNDGSIVLIGTGGSGVLQYSINGGNTWQTSGSFTGLPGGMYYAMVKDAGGCKDGEKIQVMQPPLIVVGVRSNPASCNGGNDGSINVTQVTGGTGNFVFSLNNVAYQSGSVFSDLTAGTYTVYAKDVNGCVASATVAVTQPSAIAATLTTGNASCNESYNGMITVNATGGSGMLAYSLDGENFVPSNEFDELGAGSYTVTVRDEHGCMTEVNTQITEPTAVTATITTGSSTCGNANGNLLAVGSGGSGSGYTYSIDGITFNGGGSFGGLASGNYNVIIMDGTGCSGVVSTAIDDANGPAITSVSSTNVACNEGNDGTITINTVTGGTGTLNYSVNGSTWQLSTSFNGLNAGMYSVLVKDANGCVGQSTVTLTEPNPIVVTTVASDLNCHGDNTGTVTVNAGGGFGTLAYCIDGEIGYQSSNVFNNMGAGNYLAIVRDAAGCYGNAHFVITEPTQIQVSAGVLDVMCNAGSTGAVYVNAEGGTGSLQYSLDGVNYQSSSSFTGLMADSYTVYVQDGNGCLQTLSVDVTQPLPMMINSSIADVVCSGGNNGVIDLGVTGGINPYWYSWSNGEHTEDVFNLSAGTYSVSINDMNGCNATSTFVVTEPNSPLIVNGNITDATGQTTADGSIDITTTGGVAPYTFLWSNGSTSEDISGVTPGSYTVTITDANGCATSGVYTVGYNIGISEPGSQSGITVYPNPAHELINVDAGSVKIDKVEVIDVLGQVMLDAQPNTSKVQLNTENLSAGVYFVRAYTVNGVITRRIEVSK